MVLCVATGGLFAAEKRAGLSVAEKKVTVHRGTLTAVVPGRGRAVMMTADTIRPGPAVEAGSVQVDGRPVSDLPVGAAFVVVGPAAARLRCPDGTAVDLLPGSRGRCLAAAAGRTGLSLQAGGGVCTVHHDPAAFALTTPAGQVVTLGTVYGFRLIGGVDGPTLVVAVVRGAVRLEHPTGSLLVGPGERAAVPPPPAEPVQVVTGTLLREDIGDDGFWLGQQSGWSRRIARSSTPLPPIGSRMEAVVGRDGRTLALRRLPATPVCRFLAAVAGTALVVVDDGGTVPAAPVPIAAE